MTTPDAVEAAAETIYEQQRAFRGAVWSAVGPQTRASYIASATAALAAAAPLIAQQALLDAVQIVQSCNNATDEMCEVIQEASDALTARAATLTTKEN